jgi:hypothetical protein
MPDASKPDLSEFYKYSRPKRPPCRIGHALTLLSKPDQTRLQAALDTDKNLITAGAIITWLEARDIKNINGASPITAHRKHTCTCFDD